MFSGIGSCEISIFLKFMAVNNLTFSFYIWVTFDNNTVILLSSTGKKMRFAGLTAAVCALRHKSHDFMTRFIFCQCICVEMPAACIYIQALKAHAHLTNSSIDLTVLLIDKVADAQRSLRRDQIYIVLISTKAKPMEADKTKLIPFFLERLRGAALVKLREKSASNNSENRVISTSSCNTMTPIHQSHLL